MSEYRVRPVEADDRDGLLDVLRRTLVAGEPMPFPVMDLDHLLALFLDYYLACEPEAGRVVVDAGGRVVGYLLGTIHPDDENRWQRRQALALAWRWLRRWPEYDGPTRWLYRLRLRDALASLRDPAPTVPAHFHWHLLPEARGRLGRDLLLGFRDYAAARGVTGFGGEQVMRVGRKDPELFRRLGGQIVHRAPHYTLSALLGEPVERVTIIARIEDVHW